MSAPLPTPSSPAPPPPDVRGNSRTHCSECGRKLEEWVEPNGYDRHGEPRTITWLRCPKFARNAWQYMFLARLGHDCVQQDGWMRLEWR